MAADAVVEGRVKSYEAADFSADGQRPATVILEVTRTLKGNVSREIHLVTEMMCYRSFSSEDFKLGRTFILPLVKVDRDVLGEVLLVTASPLKVPDDVYSMYYLRGCAHSALELIGSAGYTNEFVRGQGAKRYYLGYPLMRALFFIGAFDIKRVAVESVAVCLLYVALRVRRRRCAARAGGSLPDGGASDSQSVSPESASDRSPAWRRARVLLFGIGLQVVLLVVAEPVYRQVLDQPHGAWPDWLATLWTLTQTAAPGVVVGVFATRRYFLSGFLVAALGRLIVLGTTMLEAASAEYASAFSLVGELVALLALALVSGLVAHVIFMWRGRRSLMSNVDG